MFTGSKCLTVFSNCTFALLGNSSIEAKLFHYSLCIVEFEIMKALSPRV